MKSTSPPLEAVAEARARFLELAVEAGYEKAVAIMGQEFARGDRLAAWQAAQCGRKLAPPAGTAAGTHRATKAKANVYANLLANCP